MNRKQKETKLLHAVRRSIITTIFLIIIIFLINIAPNYLKEAKDDRVNIIINNKNVTNDLKNSILIRDGKAYISTADIKNFLDEYLIEDNDSVILTSSTKTVKFKKMSDYIDVNTSYVKIDEKSFDENENTYLSIKELSSIYNYEYTYNDSKKRLMIDSLNKRYVEAISKKNQEVKYKATSLSKCLVKIKRGEKVTVVQDFEKNADFTVGGWVRIRTQDGTMGYVKKSGLQDENVLRENLESKKINEKISMVWEYYSPYQECPTPDGKIEGVNVVSPSFYELKADGSIKANVGTKGENYISWAKENGYKIWPTLSNINLTNLDHLSQMLSSFENREKLIDNIIKNLAEDNVDGVNIDFENMYKKDKDNYSRFIIELAPRIHEIGMTLCVDVTEPDGSDTWSLCYDRNTLANVSDYLVYIGYEQHNASSKAAGSVAGYDWVEINIKKFLGQEEVKKEKLIMAMPFYTRLWCEKDGKLTSKVVNMKDVTIPSKATKIFDEKTKQNYIEYKQNGATYKMWIEDVDSISNKLDLINNYDLAGCGFWEYGRENKEVWNVIKEKMKMD